MKPEETTTNRQIYERLRRLPIVQTLDTPKLIAYIGLNMVNKGKVVYYAQGIRIINHSKLDYKLVKTGEIPFDNLLEAMIYLVVTKRKKLEYFFNNKDLEIWSNEITAPLFDILEELSRIYNI